MTPDNRKRNLIFLCIAMCIAGVLFSCRDNDIEYTRIVMGKDNGVKRNSDSVYYKEYVLMQNVSRNDFEQSKAMIAYFDSVGPSISYISKIPMIEHYYMSFYKSTRASREFFMEAGKYWAEKENVPDRITKKFADNEPESYLGHVHMVRCDSDIAKWDIKFDKKVGISVDNWIESEEFILQNECGYFQYNIKENKELVNYYKGLREKK